jgi:amidase
LFVEDALERAELLDLYFHQTGSLIGPLHGLPIALSDECNIHGKDSSLGCICGSFKPQNDAPLTLQLKTCGAIVFCKTNVPWHLMFQEPANPIFGKTINEKKIGMSFGGRAGALALLVSKCII